MAGKEKALVNYRTEGCGEGYGTRWKPQRHCDLSKQNGTKVRSLS